MSYPQMASCTAPDDCTPPKTCFMAKNLCTQDCDFNNGCPSGYNCLSHKCEKSNFETTLFILIVITCVVAFLCCCLKFAMRKLRRCSNRQTSGRNNNVVENETVVFRETNRGEFNGNVETRREMSCQTQETNNQDFNDISSLSSDPPPYGEVALRPDAPPNYEEAMRDVASST